MKRILLLSVAILAIAFSADAKKMKAKKSGSWAAIDTWGEDPALSKADTIEITDGMTITVTKDLKFTKPVFILVEGVLVMQGQSTTLEMVPGSTIKVNDGTITGDNTNGSQKIKLDKEIFTFKQDGQTITGYQIANSSAGFFPFYPPLAAAPIILPVQFTAFTVAQKEKNVLVQWATASEQNAASFEVERSLDAANWSKIGSVAAAGFSSSLKQYSFTDKSLTASVAYYRVKQLDVNGNFVYTAVKQIKNSNAAAINIAGGQGRVVLSIGQQVKNTLLVRIINFNGQVISQQTLNNVVGQVVLPTALKGQFVVSVSNNDIQAAGQVVL